MTFRAAAFAFGFLSFIAPSQAQAQIRIGGGTCSSASLNGTYSATLTGRSVNSSLTFATALEGIGTATFDGQSQVTFTLKSNTNQTPGMPQTLAGAYSLQANCTGVLTMTSGETGTWSIESYNGGKDYLLTGQDGTYTFTGSGALMPAAACSASQLNGSYSFNGSGFALTAGAISGANNVSGLLQFDGKGAVTANWNTAAIATSTSTSATGQYLISPSCVGSATINDTAGNAYTFQFIVTTSNGSNFLVTAAGPQLMFTGGGRTETVTAPCSNSTLTGVYSLVITGRNVSSAGVLTSVLESTGSASFDGAGSVTFTLTANTNLLLGAPESLEGTYTLGSSCTGSVDITAGNAASFNLIAWNFAGNQAKSFAITGNAAYYPLVYPLTGSGSAQPVSCSAGTISGDYAFSGSGNSSAISMGSSSLAAVNSISGLLHFDGRGNLNGSWSVSTAQFPTPDTVMGQYAVAANCVGSATVTDPSGSSWTLDFTVTSANGANFGLDIVNLTSEFNAGAHSTFTDPGLSVVSAASGAAGSVPPGSIFAVYGADLTTGSAQATKIPLSTTLLNTSVTVNGEAAPLFYVGQSQINAQMPLDVQPGVASVVVRSASSTSNTVAVTVPATAAPGVFVQYPTNQAVVQNQDLTENTPASPAHVGDTVTAYFTGGGPVNAAGPWLTGAASPNGLSSVVENVQVTVGGTASPSITYTGLTATLVGLYQVDFVIPQVSAGDRNLILTINGAPSAVTTISIAD